MLHWYDTTQRMYNTPLWFKKAASHSFNTQFYEEYMFIDQMCSNRRKFIWTPILLMKI